ncbi:MAG: aminopeptidase P family protein [Steroidobacteraceae bacterium]|nr:aminopeptidase P family protein [Steroidobacteraceae bacterium]
MAAPADGSGALQSFEVKGGPALGRRNLPRLRRRLESLGLDAFLVPHEDEYQNEYLPEANERLAWVSGFTGSAGAAWIGRGRAVLFVDGRYTLQGRGQTDPELFEVVDLLKPGIAGWLAANVRAGERIGYDPRLHTPDSLAALETACASAGATLVPLEENPIDAAWQDRPPAPAAMMVRHPVEFAGEEHAAKRERLAAELRAAKLAAFLLTSPASIAWLLNVRGGDVRHSPLCLATALLHADGAVDLFLEPAKTSHALGAHLGETVRLHPPGALPQALAALCGSRVGVDPASTAAWFFDRLHAAGAEAVRGPDPCVKPRACKNAIEIEGARRAHRRDGLVLTRFLHWLATEAQSGREDEISAARRLEAMRRELPELFDLSFETISAAGPNSALPHYRASVKSNRRLKRGTLYLVDSGAQFRDGTTDVTRTVAIGRPTREMRERYTQVLRGHIALATVRFPAGTTGTHLDALARLPLWQAGLDYDHGTGHGVGSYLGVHEGPQRIARALNAAALEPGMIVSNEPGYYRAGEYGIRIENLQVVTPPAAIEGGDRSMLGFEPLTLAPLARDLILRGLLLPAERDWVDRYHARVLEAHAPRLDAAVRAWLEAQCAPL